MPCAVNDGEAQPNPALCSSTQIKASQHALAGENSLCVPDLPFHLLIAPLPRENTLSQLGAGRGGECLKGSCEPLRNDCSGWGGCCSQGKVRALLQSQCLPLGPGALVWLPMMMVSYLEALHMHDRKKKSFYNTSVGRQEQEGLLDSLLSKSRSTQTRCLARWHLRLL